MKTAIFVEGQSEMLFVADVLTKYYNYDSSQCGFICISLEADQFNYRQNPTLITVRGVESGHLRRTGKQIIAKRYL